jgi:glutathione synthase
VLLLRNNPSVQRARAQSAGIHFGRLAMRHGVIVMNDPNGLAKAFNKLYLQSFPEKVRPRTLVNFTRAVLEALERKVQYMKFYRCNFSNAELATL